MTIYRDIKSFQSIIWTNVDRVVLMDLVDKVISLQMKNEKLEHHFIPEIFCHYLGRAFAEVEMAFQGKTK